MADETPSAQSPNPDTVALIELAAEIASAYVRNNSVPASDVPALLSPVHGALASLGAPEAVPGAPEKLKPPVPIKKTVTDEFLISLEDGRRYKTLKRHLTRLGLTPETYRAKWGLPHGYPMAAPAYSRARSELAREVGLGTVRRGDGQLLDEAGQ